MALSILITTGNLGGKPGFFTRRSKQVVLLESPGAQKGVLPTKNLVSEMHGDASRPRQGQRALTLQSMSFEIIQARGIMVL